MSDPYDGDVGVHYRTSRERFMALIRELTPEELATPVPACPGWSVSDVLGHVAGITDDALHGRMKGIPDDTQTADQVARSSQLTVEALLDRWEQQAPDFQAVLTSVGPSIAPAAIDVAVHEQDIRGALGKPGSRYNATIAWALPMIVHGFERRLASAGLPAVRVDVEGEIMAEGVPDGPVLRITQFEAFRAFLGRRTLDEVAAYAWSNPPSSACLQQFFVFGPTAKSFSD
jgi:uncharacterized protein (TIGR03083 family)